MVEVVLYVQRGCGPCLQAREWLCARGVAFTERDVARSPAWLLELQALGARVTPTVVVTGRGGRSVVAGFRPEALRAALAERAGATAAGPPG